jgi:hypothetical protein
MLDISSFAIMLLSHGIIDDQRLGVTSYRRGLEMFIMLQIDWNEKEDRNTRIVLRSANVLHHTFQIPMPH